MPEIVRFHSRDRATVESTWSQFAPSARLHRVDPDLRFDWRSAALDRVSIVEYRLTAAVRSSIRPEGQLFACAVGFLHGSLRSGRQELDAGRPWISDGREVVADREGAANVKALVFDPGWAQETARRITGDDRLRLQVTDSAPSDLAAAAHWSRAVTHLGAEAAATGGNPLIEAELARHALMTTLAVFPTTVHGRDDRTPQTSAAPVTVRRAIAFMEEHAHEPITIDDVAHAVHISTRGLQYAFRRALGITPRQHLARVRLDGAHRDLLRADPGETVAGIARRWGFSHPSRFTAEYRRVHGCPPGQALRSR
ncbi:AraC family transcriptional regulator [Microbacterium capsulatum]|uniref:AraC family transcriptional regulator n=1 Tax=Microbacterium capsulatum TaxID=3041921 RepID=A0ABU0XKC5_9MICO|nr:AraC family transcriptional regulator [Microbacterium sp. ASV81]MDQ4215588.1 AraC family transcriptional regulator [Microbacterium sp. ASV81]